MIEADSAEAVEDLVPVWNARTYQLLYVVEVSLREMVIEAFYAAYGWNWYKRLPKDLLDKYKDGRDREKRSRTIRSASHDPIYYCDFPDISKLLESGANWDTHFSRVLGKKESFIGSLKLIEDIRNKVAHNRTAMKSDYEAVKLVYALLLNALGREKIRDLISRSDKNSGMENDLDLLEQEIIDAQKTCQECGRLPDFTEWSRVKVERWFGRASLDFDLSPLEVLFSQLEEYRLLPPSFPVYKVRPWMRERRLMSSFEGALDLVQQMKEGVDR